MPKFRVEVDQYDALFAAGGLIAAAGVGVFAWPLLLVAAGAGLMFWGYRGAAARGSARQPDPPAR